VNLIPPALPPRTNRSALPAFDPPTCPALAFGKTSSCTLTAAQLRCVGKFFSCYDDESVQS